MNGVRYYKLLIAVNALIPIALAAYDWQNGTLGVNPVEFVLRASGVMTLTTLFISLAVTPLRKLFGWNQLIKYRRILGLVSFGYACVHLLIYLLLDRSGGIADVIGDVIQRPFIAIGMLAFAGLVPLAATSTNGMVKRLGGKRWQKLHRIVYAIAILGVIHFWMIVKSDVFYPAIFALVLAILLGYRLWSKLNEGKAKKVNATSRA